MVHWGAYIQVFCAIGSYEMAKLAKRTVLYPARNPINLDVEQLTLNMNSNTSNRATIIRPSVLTIASAFSCADY